MRKQDGITLIALAITIVVLLILVGVSITSITEDDGIVTKANEAKDDTIAAQEQEKSDISEIYDFIDTNSSGDSTTDDTTSPGTVSIVSHEFSPSYFDSRANIVWNNTINVEKSNPTETLTYRYKFYSTNGTSETYNEACDFVITSSDTTISGTKTIEYWEYRIWWFYIS